jgi:serine/threonine protein kinase
VKLVDFGFSACVADGRKLHVFCGTPSYIPPEVIKRGEYAGTAMTNTADTITNTTIYH